MRYKFREDMLEALQKLGYRKPKSVTTKGALDRFFDKCFYDMHEVKKYSVHKMARLLPITYHSVHAHLADIGVQFRPRGGVNNYKHGRCSRKKKEAEICGTSSHC